MKYFLDTEFIEGFHKPLFGKRRHFIDLISIGIVAEDGREYYAISNEFNAKDANEWVRTNVIKGLPDKHADFHDSPRRKQEAQLYKSNSTISFEVGQFMQKDKAFFGTEFPEIYGYYADYDWVLFCSLFGRMIDLPKGFPMYCRDLKQIMDEEFTEDIKKWSGFPAQKDEHNALADARWNKELHSFIEKFKNVKI
jgi:hypothetical protein